MPPVARFPSNLNTYMPLAASFGRDTLQVERPGDFIDADSGETQVEYLENHSRFLRQYSSTSQPGLAAIALTAPLVYVAIKAQACAYR